MSRYSFEAKPRAVEHNRRKNKGLYRDEDEQQMPQNVMFDRRVIRGNTYAAQHVAVNAHAEAERIQQAQLVEKRRKEKLRRMRMGNIIRPHTPEAVEGRQHIEVQTGLYLEELTDKVPESHAETQTEAFLDRPPSPLFMPAKIGVDVATQVLPGELFDFNLEVEPILEVLVGKTLEESMMEVLEEEELDNIRKHQEEFEQIRNAELAEVQRLESEAQRRYEEKERRLRQEEMRHEKEETVMEKVASRAFAKNYLSNLHENVFNKLLDTGHFYDPLTKEVEDQFMPWLEDCVQFEIRQTCIARQLVDALLLSTLEAAERTRVGVIVARDRKVIEAEEAENQRRLMEMEGNDENEDIHSEADAEDDE